MPTSAGTCTLQDCLHGGFLGEPPYDITVHDADAMTRRFGHEGLVRYCDAILGVIAAGGQGIVTRDAQPWYVSRRAQASARRPGATLLDALGDDVIEHAPARLRLVASNGEVLRVSGTIEGLTG